MIMTNYRYKQSEVDAMKNNILVHAESEQKHEGKFSAWRLGLVLRGDWRCGTSKRKQDKAYRDYILYCRLTTNDIPNF